MKATIVSKHTPEHPMASFFAEKEAQACKNFKACKLNLTRVSTGYYYAATQTGMWEITSPREGHETIWQIEWTQTGKHTPDNTRNFDTLKEAREFINDSRYEFVMYDDGNYGYNYTCKHPASPMIEGTIYNITYAEYKDRIGE